MRTRASEAGASAIPRSVWASALLLAIATFAVYSPALRHPFVMLDDPAYVTENVPVQQGLSIRTVRWAFTTLHADNWHPITWLSHALDCEIFALHPGGHHATSIILHALNVALLFLLLWKATGRKGRSLVAAALFALHPINVESVAWVAERKSVLSMFFLLLTLAAYGWYVACPGIRRYVLVGVSFAFALAAKPMAVTLPFALLLLDIWPLRRISLSRLTSGAQPRVHRVILEKLPLFALAAASCVMTLIAQRGALASLQKIPLGERVLNAIYSYVMYLWKLIWPTRLAVFYSSRGSRLAGGQVVACIAVLIFISVVVWRLRAKRYLLVGWLWFLGTMVPMIGLVQVGEQGMADRYAYLPFLGLFVAVVWGAADLAANLRISPGWTAAAAVALLAVLAVLTSFQLRTWDNTLTMWTHSLEVDPRNYVAEDAIGVMLLENGMRTSGQACVEASLTHFQKAVQINPSDPLGHFDIGYCAQSHGQSAEAIEQYKLTLASAPNKYLKSRTYINLGLVYLNAGDLSTGRDSFARALEILPDDPEILQHMADLHVAQEILQLSDAAQAHPTPAAYLLLGRRQQAAGRSEDAQTSYREALKLNPKFSEARTALNSLSVSAR